MAKKKHMIELTEDQMFLVREALGSQANRTAEVAGQVRAVMHEDSNTRNAMGERMEDHAQDLRNLIELFIP